MVRAWSAIERVMAWRIHHVRRSRTCSRDGIRICRPPSSDRCCLPGSGRGTAGRGWCILGDRDDQAQVGLGHFALGARRLSFAGRICLLMSFSSLIGIPMRSCRGNSFFCSSLMLGALRVRIGVSLAAGRREFAVDPVEVEFVAGNTAR